MQNDPHTISLPRILCLHGGGVNAKVFNMQCRVISTRLRSHFRLVFVDGPFECPPHEAIAGVYGEYGPFYRWLRFQDDHDEIGAREAAAKVLQQLSTAIEEDEGTGPWVGVLGFSQGGKIAASLLWAQDHIAEEDKRPLPGIQFRFGVLMAASAPAVMLDPTGTLPRPRYVIGPEEPSMSFSDWPAGSESDDGKHVVRSPTLHVHGLQDPAIEHHRRLLEAYCKRGTTKLVEWDGSHRLPIKTHDVELVASKILELAEETDVLL